MWMKKAVRKASFGTEGTTKQKYEDRISDSLLVEKNGLARAEKLENHKSQGRPRIQLARSFKWQAKKPGRGLPGEGEFIPEKEMTGWKMVKCVRQYQL